MRKTARIIVSAALVLALGAVSLPAHGNDLGYLAGDRRPIKVFLKNVVNRSGQPQILPAEFAKELAKAFVERKSVSFAIAQTPDESDVQVSATIESYQYLEKDPIRPSPTATLILDAVTSENFTEMMVRFAVIDTRSGNEIWNDTVTSYVKRMMTPAQSIPVIYDKVSRAFLSKAFGKGIR